MSCDEYRYLTFLYYDLVESTPMSQRLDEETWRDFLGDFIKICNHAIRLRGGEIQGNHGDGALAYFGYPATQRISAVQAVRAGLDLVEGADTLFADLNVKLKAAGVDALKIRVGIHSGRVVMGAIEGRRTATGFVLAFTERLHRCAEPNTVVMGSATLELLRERFIIERVGERKLKGVDQPALCFRPIAENDNWRVPRSPQVGRDDELSMLNDQWQSLTPGKPFAIALLGEAGIGKSRLVNEFRHSIKATDVTRYIWRCVPEMKDSAWHPILAALKKRLSAPIIHELADPLAKLEAILPASLHRNPVLPAVAQLLGISNEQQYTDSFASSESRRQAYFQLIVDALVYESQQRSLLLTVEDVQWIDASTLECLTRLKKRTDCGNIMLLFTQRTEASNALSLPFDAHTFEISRLSEESARALITGMPGGRQLSRDSIARVLERSDGVPLFIEESTNLEIDKIQSDLGHTDVEARISNDNSKIPVRLFDLLTARLESVGEARETASLAAAIGRQFPIEFLEIVSTLPREKLNQHLQLLIDSGLVIPLRDELGISFGRFKHALVRDSAYGVLLNSTRRQFHKAIASELESNGMLGKPASADELATHFAAAGNTLRAFEHWMVAGLQARRNSEQYEALGYFHRAELLIDALPTDNMPSRDQQVLTLHLALLRCHVALTGYSSDDAYRHAKCAEQLALKCDNEVRLINARFGLSSWLFVRGRIEEALHLATDCLQRTESALTDIGTMADAKQRDPLVLTVARASWACGNMEFHTGRFEPAMKRIDRCISLCRSTSPLSRYMDQDPLVMCLCYRAWYEWESGDPDQAVLTVAEAVDIARDNGRAYSIALSLAFHSAICLFRGEAPKSIEHATESIEISKTSHYVSWHSWALVLKGIAQCEQPAEQANGLNDIIDGLKLWDSSGAIITRPFMLAQLAKAFVFNGELDRALQTIESALTTIDQYGDRYYEAAALRIQGGILARINDTKRHSLSPMTCFERSIMLAKQRHQHGTALRTAIEIYAYGQDDTNDAQTRLQPRLQLQSALAKMKSGMRTRDPTTATNLLKTNENTYLPETV